MNELFSQIQIQINDKVYVKNPDSSELGKNIVRQGLLLVDKLGFESFTFGKLAKQLSTTESSVYRYFESKYKLLIYLTSWYWGFLEYQLVFSTANIDSPEDRFSAAIKVLCADMKRVKFSNIDFAVLNRVVIAESSKAYLTKDVDHRNKDGCYLGYKRIVKRLSEIIEEINPKYAFPHTLSSTIIEGIHHQKYFAEHLPSLTDVKDDTVKLIDFYTQLALSDIKTR